MSDPQRPQDPDPKFDLTSLLVDARWAIVTMGCGHPTVCGDAKCREAGHDHENYGEDGWSCGEECPCVPACEGHEPETCEQTTRARETVVRLEEAIESLRFPPSPLSAPATTAPEETP